MIPFVRTQWELEACLAMGRRFRQGGSRKLGVASEIYRPNQMDLRSTGWIGWSSGHGAR